MKAQSTCLFTIILLALLAPLSIDSRHVAAQASSGVTFNVSGSAPGGSVSATAAGFTSGETVTLYWGSLTGAMLGQAAADTHGAALISFSVPNTPRGLYTIWAKGTTGTETSGQLPVGSILFGNAGSVPAGGSVMLSGFGFDSNESITFTGACSPACGAPATLALANADSDGTVPSTSVPIPVSTPAGSYTVTAAGSAGGAAQSIMLTVTHAPIISLSPKAASPGQTTVVTGLRFRPGARISIFWETATGRPLRTWTADAGGSFTRGGVVIPQAPAGSHTVVIRGAGGDSAGATLTVVPIVHVQFGAGKVGIANAARGYGFAAQESVEARWDSVVGAILGTGTTTRNGTVANLRFTAPVAGFGGHSVFLIGKKSGLQASTAFSVLSSLDFSPSQGKAGSLVRAIGHGFGPIEQLQLVWNCSHTSCPDRLVLKTVRTDASGNLSSSVLIPNSAPPGTAYPVEALSEGMDGAIGTFEVTG